MNRERVFWVACGLAVVLHFVGCTWRVVDRETARAINVPLGRMLLGDSAPLFVLGPGNDGGIAVCARAGLSRDAAFVMGVYIPIALVVGVIAMLILMPAKPKAPQPPEPALVATEKNVSKGYVLVAVMLSIVVFTGWLIAMLLG